MDNPNPQDSFNSQKRMFIGMGLIFVLLMVYQYFFAPKPPPETAKPEAKVEGPATTATPPPVGPTAAPAQPEAAAPAGEEAKVTEVARELEHVHLRFSSEGAGLVSAELQGKKMREQQRLSVAQGYARMTGKDVETARQVNLAVPVGKQLPLSTAIQGNAPVPAEAKYRLVEGGEGANGPVTFVTTRGPWEITKKFEFPKPDGFELAMTVTVKNVSQQAQSGELAVLFPRQVDPTTEQASSFFGGLGNQAQVSCFYGTDYKALVPGKDEGHTTHEGQIAYAGVDLQYFLGVLYPLDGPMQGKCDSKAQPTERIATAMFPLSLQPGQASTQKFGAYLGPKDPDLLSKVSAGGEIPKKLNKTVDFGIWEIIAKLLLGIMRFFHGLVHNWGVAVICLTILVKLALLPLQHKSMVSMEAMKKLQPRLEEIKKKYPEDREKQQLETMKIYQEAKVNPVAGCLPMLIQMPVWIALFTALRHSYDLYNEPFITPLWTDLTYKDPTYLIPLALGITMIITQRLQPQMVDKSQAVIMTWVMPVFFTFIMLNYPMGLALYIFTNNLLTIAQTYGLRRWLEKRGHAAPRPATVGGSRK